MGGLADYDGGKGSYLLKIKDVGLVLATAQTFWEVGGVSEAGWRGMGRGGFGGGREVRGS